MITGEVIYGLSRLINCYAKIWGRSVFNKKAVLPKLSYFLLKVNLAAIEQWLPNQGKIDPIPKKNWESFDIKEYKITLLPSDPFVFYHNNVNEFSSSIGGTHVINNKNFIYIEWFWEGSYFYLSVSEPNSEGRVPIFAAPIEEMFNLLKTGNNLSEQFLGDEKIIKLHSEGNHNEVYRSRSGRHSLAYSNSLVSLTLICASSNDLVSY